MNIFIGLFFLGDVIVLIVIFIGKPNVILEKIKLLGLSVNSVVFYIFYAFFGTGCILWTSSYTQ